MGHPEICDARALGKKYGLPTTIILFEMPDGTIGYASYGADRKPCDRARRIADSAFDAAYSWIDMMESPPK